MDKPRPRTFSTLQLATQKFKLRSLERIIGCNIAAQDVIKSDNDDSGNDEDEGLVFYSLHYNKDEPAFYCSEKLPLHLQRQKWAEIGLSAEILKSNQNCVCVKVWQSLDKQAAKHDCARSALSTTLKNNAATSTAASVEPPDKLLFSWAVYFSGLSMIGQSDDVVFSKNSLIFQLNGAYFSSPACFTLAKSQAHDTPPAYQRQPISSSAPTTPFQINSPRIQRSPSPALNQQQPQQQTQKPTRQVNQKARLLQLEFPQADVRTSYDLENLLAIQQKIRRRLQKIRESAEIAEEIRHLSVSCITKNELQRRIRTTSTTYSSLSYHQQQQQYHSMGRKLTILLNEQQQAEPASLLRAQKLQQNLEKVRSKHELLQAERAAFQSNNEHLRTKLKTLRDERVEIDRNLETKVQSMLEEKRLLAEQKQQQLRRIQRRRHVAEHMERRMTSLCLELQEIYPIRRNSHGFYTVSGIPFPSNQQTTTTTTTTSQSSNNSINTAHISPLALSASLGYVAHLAQMMAVILDQPLRNPIIHEGSRSRIKDIIKDIPYGPRDFPLYSRSLIPTKLVNYAIFLLNQNIAQLCYEITGVYCDHRDTIENILRIFSTLSQIDKNSLLETRLHLRSSSSSTHPSNRLDVLKNSASSNGSISNENEAIHLGSSDDQCDGVSKTQSSMEIRDLNLAVSNQLVVECGQLDHNRTRYRCSRSMGSYSDSEVDNLNAIEQPCFNSDPNIQHDRRSHT